MFVFLILIAILVLGCARAEAFTSAPTGDILYLQGKIRDIKKKVNSKLLSSMESSISELQRRTETLQSESI